MALARISHEFTSEKLLDSIKVAPPSPRLDEHPGCGPAPGSAAHIVIPAKAGIHEMLIGTASTPGFHQGQGLTARPPFVRDAPAPAPSRIGEESGLDSAVALFEYNSVAAGFACCDALIKMAPIRVLAAHPVCPGKFLIIFGGDVAAVEASYERGLQVEPFHLVDQLYLARVSPQVLPAISRCTDVDEVDALGVVETFTGAACIRSADAAAKAAAVRLIEIRIANGLGGKAFYTLTGPLAEVEAAVEAGQEAPRESGLLVKQIILPRPHAELHALVF